MNMDSYISFPTFLSLCFTFFSFLYYSVVYETFLQSFCKTCLQWFEFDVLITQEEIESLPSSLIIVTSHTSIYDFVFGFIIYSLYFRKKYSAKIIMKKSFEVYVSPLLQWMDSKFQIIQVDSSKQGLTQKIVSQLQNQSNYVMGIAPEGTRRCVSKLRKGYYYIAKELHIPVVYLGIDFLERKIKLEPVHLIEDSWEKEEMWFIENCKKYTPLYPEQCFWTRDEYLDEITSS